MASLAAGGRSGRRPRKGPLVLGYSNVWDERVERAAQAVRATDDKRPLEAVVAARDSANPRLRLGSADVLAERRDPSAPDVLIGLLKHREAWVRRSAVQTMGRLHDPRAVEALIAALRDADAGVRWQAADALKGLTGQAFGPDQSAAWEQWWQENKASFLKQKQGSLEQ